MMSDEPQGPAAEASRAALKAAEQHADESGMTLLAGYTMVLLTDAEEPSGDEPPKAQAGMWIAIDAERGPIDPREFLDFLLAGAAQFAELQGIPFRTFDMPEQPGQG